MAIGMSLGGVSAGLISVMLALERRQTVGVFERLGSTSPDNALSRQELGLRDSRIFRRLVRRGVLRAGGTGAYYLDQQALARDRRRRRTVIAVIVGLIMVGLILLLVGEW